MYQHLAWLRADTVLQREKLDQQALLTDMGKEPSSKPICGIPDRVTVARWGRSLYSRHGIGAISVALLRVAKRRASVIIHCDVPGETVR
jgi:hypothetical protein